MRGRPHDLRAVLHGDGAAVPGLRVRRPVPPPEGHGRVPGAARPRPGAPRALQEREGGLPAQGLGWQNRSLSLIRVVLQLDSTFFVN